MAASRQVRMSERRGAAILRMNLDDVLNAIQSLLKGPR